MKDNTLSQSEKYAIINILTMIMEADTIIHPKEIEYMDSILADFAITVDDNEHMEHMDMAMCLSIIKNMSEENQRNAKEMFITMATIDGFFDPREKKLIESL